MSCSCLNLILMRLGLLRIAQETIFFRVEGGFFVLIEVHNCEKPWEKTSFLLSLNSMFMKMVELKS